MKKFLIIFLFFNRFFCPAQLVINIEMVFNGETLLLNKKQYINRSGDTLTIEEFKFYVSNFSVCNAGKWKKIPGLYFLVDAEIEGSKRLALDKITAMPDSISFYIGVDSLANISGALDGALDPSLGMFWAWNTGYINAKLEGKSNACNTLHHLYEFHIGGYLSPFNALRKVSLETKNSSGVLVADASKWFFGATPVKLKEFNSVVTPSKYAMAVADNYRNMFSVR